MPTKSARSPKTRRPPTQSPGQSWSLNNDEIEASLLTGRHARELDELLGEGLHEELAGLAREASRRGVRGGPRVLILPGIMGSKLGVHGLIFDDVYWFDPADWSFGVATRLALGGDRRITPLGAFLTFYLRMKLHLRIGGLDADFHSFDWRRSVKDLGAELAAHIVNEEHAPEVFLVGHSMGGLVARAAIKALPAAKRGKVARLIMLGTPNYGSFCPVQVLRGVFSTLNWVALADFAHTKEELVNKVFSTFPSLYEMLPSPERYGDVDFFSADTWPKAGPKARPELFKNSRRMQEWLAPADENTFLIAGFNQETAVGVALENDEFRYISTNAGDGTVPWDLCRLEGAKTFFVEESHGSLPNNLQVIRATADLIDNGRTDQLPTKLPALRRAVVSAVTDTELRTRQPVGERTRGEVRAAEWRGFLRGFADPPTPIAPGGTADMPAATAGALLAPAGAPLAAADASARRPWTRLTVGRVQQHRLELFLARGDITDIDARAYVFGLFREVTPSGPARAIDELLDGAITEFTRRRMFSGAVGEVFLLPAQRRQLRTEMILFAGLGPFDQFGADVQQVTAENVMRTFVRTGVEEFATVLMGGSSSNMPTAEILGNLARGFVRGKLDSDTRRNFRRIILVERDAARYEEIRQEAYRLAGTDLFQDIELSLTEIEPATRVLVRATDAASSGGREPVYLMVRQEENPETSSGRTKMYVGDQKRKSSIQRVARKLGDFRFKISMLGGGGKAAILSATSEDWKSEKLEALFDEIEAQQIGSVGKTIGEDALPEAISDALRAVKDHHLVVVHDGESSKLPWETLLIGDGKAPWAPAADVGMSRRYLADNLSIAKYLAGRQDDGVLDVLVIINPTGDLDGAEVEGERIVAMFADNPAVKVQSLRREAATKRAVLRELGSGRYDVVHYAGHAFFDSVTRSKSGLVCHGHEIASGADMASLGNLPALAVFNACESGRVRGRPKWNERRASQRVVENVGLAEALMRGGIANYVGTYWPVGDASADRFAQVFYTALLAGETIGGAVVKARRELKDVLKSVDWADYIHYGDFNFVLKRRGG